MDWVVLPSFCVGFLVHMCWRSVIPMLSASRLSYSCMYLVVSLNIHAECFRTYLAQLWFLCRHSSCEKVRCATSFIHTYIQCGRLHKNVGYHE
jgi:hypothetical protein